MKTNFESKTIIFRMIVTKYYNRFWNVVKIFLISLIVTYA